MNVFDLVASLTLDTSSYDRALTQARNSASFSGNDISRGLKSVGKAATFAGSVLVGEAAIGVKAAADFESAFAGAMKTINFEVGTSQEEIDAYFDSLKTGILEMSHRLPQSAEEIAGVAEAAGQLGINNDNILEFTEVMLGLGSATNLSAQDAATGLARFANVTRMDQGDFDKLGASIVELGNNTATTESEIVYFMQNLANLSNIANFSESDIAALSATMSSTGARAEITRTTFENLALTINKAVTNGGDDLFTLARVSHRTSADFAKTWRSDPMQALELFIDGLNDLNFEENEQIDVLNELGVKQTLRQQTILRAVGAHELLTKNVKLSTEAYKENGETLEEYNALQTEVAKRNETLDSQWAMFKNSLKEVAINAGDALIPALKNLLEAMTPIINKVADFVKEHPLFIQRLGEIGLGLLGIGAASSGIEKVLNLLSAFSTRTALAVTGIVALVGVLGTLAVMYRGELGNFFSQLGLYMDNVRLGIEQVRLIIENMDWGAFGQFLGTELLLGIAGAINAGIGMISDAINNVISQINIDLPFFKWSGEEWLSSLNNGAGFLLPELDTTGLEENAETYRKQMLNGQGNYEEVRKELDEINRQKDENDKKLREGSWWGTGDTRSFTQKAYDARGEMISGVLGWLGLGDQTEKVANLFGLSEIGVVPEESIESVKSLSNAAERAAKVINGSEDEDVVNLTSGLQTVNDKLSETAEAADPISSVFEDSLPSSANALMSVLTGGGEGEGEGEETLDGSLSKINKLLESIHTNTNNIITTWNGAFVSAIKNLEKNAELAEKAFQKINDGASNAATSVDTLSKSIEGVIKSIEKLNKMEIQFPTVSGGTGVELPSIPGRASGGPVNQGDIYWVGEGGPELYVPERSGTIISNSNLNKLGQTINVTVNFNGEVIGDEQSISSYVNRAAKRAIQEEVYAAS